MFKDRKDAGLQLAEKLLTVSLNAATDQSQRLILSIPRGGVVVGAAIAAALHCPHNVIIVKKIGFPGHEEMAVGAVAENAVTIINDAVLARSDLTRADLQTQIAQTSARVRYGMQLFRQGQPLAIADRLVILVDDGIATGETMQAAVRWVQSMAEQDKARGIVIAVPVCPLQTAQRLARRVDAVVQVLAPQEFLAVGQFYRQFEQVSDDEVLDILRRQRALSLN